jgi:hypothetical protein
MRPVLFRLFDQLSVGRPTVPNFATELVIPCMSCVPGVWPMAELLHPSPQTSLVFCSHLLSTINGIPCHCESVLILRHSQCTFNAYSESANISFLLVCILCKYACPHIRSAFCCRLVKWMAALAVHNDLPFWRLGQ